LTAGIRRHLQDLRDLLEDGVKAVLEEATGETGEGAVVVRQRQRARDVRDVLVLIAVVGDSES
jgi:hypothetical protein